MTLDAPDGAVEFRYRWDDRTLLDCYRWHRRQSARPDIGRAFVLLLVLLAVGFTYCYRHRLPNSAGMSLVGFIALPVWGAVFAGLRRFYVPIILRRNAARSPAHNSPLDWRVTGDRLFFAHAHGKAELSWSAFMLVAQMSDGLLLYLQPMMYHWLPKAACTSSEAYAQTVEWAQAKAPVFRRVDWQNADPRWWRGSINCSGKPCAGTGKPEPFKHALKGIGRSG